MTIVSLGQTLLAFALLHFFFSIHKILFHLHELNTRVLNNYAWIVHENLIRH